MPHISIVSVDSTPPSDCEKQYYTHNIFKGQWWSQAVDALPHILTDCIHFQGHPRLLKPNHSLHPLGRQVSIYDSNPDTKNTKNHEAGNCELLATQRHLDNIERYNLENSKNIF